MVRYGTETVNVGGENSFHNRLVPFADEFWETKDLAAADTKMQVRVGVGVFVFREHGDIRFITGIRKGSTGSGEHLRNHTIYFSR